jgi:SAM-dependent methyltransferase
MARPARPHESWASTRTAVVWDALAPGLDLGDDQTVVDIGGGTGGFAVRIAERGHRVTVIDPSPDALAAAARRAAERGVGARVTGLQGDLADLVDLVGAGTTDLVLCHGVLGLLADPADGLRLIAQALRPGGTLSLLVSQRHAAVIARAMAGHLVQARELLTSVEPGAETGRGSERAQERRFTADECLELLTGAGYQVGAVHAVRVFTDLVPASVLELEPGAGDALVELERAVAERPEYRTVATQLHLLATRPAN